MTKIYHYPNPELPTKAEQRDPVTGLYNPVFCYAYAGASSHPFTRAEERMYQALCVLFNRQSPERLMFNIYGVHRIYDIPHCAAFKAFVKCEILAGTHKTYVERPQSFGTMTLTLTQMRELSAS